MEVTVGTSRALDCCAASYFGVICDVDVVSEPLRCMGSARFDLAAVLQIMKKTYFRVAIEMTLADGTTRVEVGEYITIAVANTQYFTDVMRAVPQAVLDDGLIEVFLMKPVPRFVCIRGFLQTTPARTRRTRSSSPPSR